MNKTIAIGLGAVLLIALVLFSTTYTVWFHEVAVKTRFGRTDQSSVDRDPGLKFRLPFFADKVTALDKRLQLHESPLDNVQTSDGLQLMVKAFMLWKVDEGSGAAGEGPLIFLQKYQSIEEANQDLTAAFRTALNSGVSQFKFEDLIGPRSQVAKTEEAIAAEMTAFAGNGIKTVAVGISQIVLPPKTSTAVLQRMQATRTTISELERQKGNARAQGIQNDAASIAEKIKAFANSRAADIRNKGSDKETQIYARLNQDPELAEFLAWLDAFEASLSQNTTIVLPTLFAPFHLAQMNAQMDKRGIPQPASKTIPHMAADGQPPADAIAAPASEAGKAQGDEGPLSAGDGKKGP